MPPAPLFSVIIPTYNRSALLRKTLETVLAQQFDSYEVIVVDDGGKDDTRQMVESFNNPKLTYYWKENAERGAARNYGAERATGQYLNFFDSDDYMLHNHLTTAELFIAERNTPAWFVTGHQVVSPEHQLIEEETHIGRPITKLKKRNFLSLDSVFVRRDVWQASPFENDRTLASVEDWVFYLRIATRHELLICNTVTSQIVQHPARSMFTLNPAALLVRNTLLRKCFNEPAVAAYLGTYKTQAIATSWLFEAVHLAQYRKYKLRSIKGLFISIVNYPLVIFSRRFLAIIKHLMLSWK